MLLARDESDYRSLASGVLSQQSSLLSADPPRVESMQIIPAFIRGLDLAQELAQIDRGGSVVVA